ncbi:MAG: TIGR03084 family protein [Actinobacteria bacterium]|nr:TIGR03084 family protein [Actinomycetota bacterium]
MGTPGEARERLDAIVSDFAAEVADLDSVLGPLSSGDFSLDTPARGWCISDQIVHLGLIDRRCLWSITDAERFLADRERLFSGVDVHVAERGRDHAELRAWWLRGASDLVAAAANIDPSAKCPWYGPSMSATSMITARLMETWAHGQDIVDALGVSRTPTRRLRHIAHIGVRARPFAYGANNMEMPPVEVRVDLAAPDGGVWTWGEEGGSERIAGDALGFCLAVTQRRHVDDCGLEITGAAAREWMSIAQAFAGPPGEGRARGQFTA